MVVLSGKVSTKTAILSLKGHHPDLGSLDTAIFLVLDELWR